MSSLNKSSILNSSEYKPGQSNPLAAPYHSKLSPAHQSYQHSELYTVTIPHKALVRQIEGIASRYILNILKDVTEQIRTAMIRYDTKLDQETSSSPPRGCKRKAESAVGYLADGSPKRRLLGYKRRLLGYKRRLPGYKGRMRRA
jgi:hypothetical protein